MSTQHPPHDPNLPQSGQPQGAQSWPSAGQPPQGQPSTPQPPQTGGQSASPGWDNQPWNQPQPEEGWDAPQSQGAAQQNWGQPQQNWGQPQQNWDQPQQNWNQAQQNWDQSQQNWNQAQPGYQQGAYAPVQPPKASGKRKAGKILMIIAGIVLLLSLIGGVLGGMAVKDLSNLKQDGVAITNGKAQITAQEGKSVVIWMPTNKSGQCTATGPDGNKVDQTPASKATFTGQDGIEYTFHRTFVAEKQGQYTVTCTGDSEGAFASYDLGGAKMVLGGLGLIGAVLGGLLGVPLFILGLILFLMGRKK